MPRAFRTDGLSLSFSRLCMYSIKAALPRNTGLGLFSIHQHFHNPRVPETTLSVIYARLWDKVARGDVFVEFGLLIGPRRVVKYTREGCNFDFTLCVFIAILNSILSNTQFLLQDPFRNTAEGSLWNYGPLELKSGLE